MSKMRIEEYPALEAYLEENGNICLREGDPKGECKVISIPQSHVKRVIEWLQILSKEEAYRSTDNDDFIAED